MSAQRWAALATVSLWCVAPAQVTRPLVDDGYRYSYYKESSLSSAAEVVTIQSKASTSRRILFDGAYVFCSASCTFTVEKGGASATTTAGSVIPINTSVVTSAVAFHTSNVGEGTALAKYPLAAGEGLPVDLKGVVLPSGAGAARNLTIRTSSMSGTVRVVVVWEEVQ